MTTEKNDTTNPTVGDVADVFVAFFGRTVPDRVDELLDAADRKVDQLLATVETKAGEMTERHKAKANSTKQADAPKQEQASTTVASEIGPVAVTLVGKLQSGDTLYLHEHWVKVTSLHPAMENDYRAVIYDILGEFDGHLTDRLISMRNSSLVIIRPRVK